MRLDHGIGQRDAAPRKGALHRLNAIGFLAVHHDDAARLHACVGQCQQGLGQRPGAWQADNRRRGPRRGHLRYGKPGGGIGVGVGGKTCHHFNPRHRQKRRKAARLILGAWPDQQDAPRLRQA